MTLQAEVMSITERWFGVFVGLVTDLRDPEGLGRVKVTLPWAPDPDSSRYEAWARVATLMAGRNRGSWFIPDVNDEVLVAFDGGDPRTPYVIGGLWNGTDTPPASMDGPGQNRTKMIRSRNGVTITLDDTDGTERCVIQTPGGQKLTLSDGPGAVSVVDANGNSVKLEAAGMTVTSSATVTIQASQVKVSAAMVSVNAGMSTFSGVLKADTVITNAVIATSYTPGAGNIW